MRRNNYSFLSSIFLFLIGLWPQFVFGDGGISSLGTLLPVFIVLAILALALFIWLILSLNLFVTKSNKITKKKINFYKAYSYIVITMLLVVCFWGLSFMGGVAMLLFLVLVIVGALTAANISRTQRLMPTE